MIRIYLENSFFEKDISVFRISLSCENDWHNKIYTGFFHNSENRNEIEISVPFYSGKLIIDYYTISGNSGSYISDNIIRFDKDIIIIRKDFTDFPDCSGSVIPACEYPWLNPVVNSSGELTICCNDPFFENSIGNIHKERLTHLWFEDEEIRKIRYSHIIGDVSYTRICAGCLGRRSSDADNAIIKEYCENIREKHGLYNLYNARLSEKVIFDNIFFELTDNCNLKCIFCNQIYKEWDKVHGISEKGFMDVHDFTAFFEKYRNILFFRKIFLFWLGEPLLHRHISLFIKKLSQFNDMFSEIEIHTNGVLIDQDFINALKCSDLNINIHISVDAVSEDTYGKVRQGKNIEKVFGNIKALSAGIGDSENIRIIIQFVVCRENHAECLDFVEYWKNYFWHEKIDYQITTYFDFYKNRIIYIRYCDPISPELEKENRELFQNARKSISHTKTPFIDYESCFSGMKPDICTHPFEFLMIRYDGAVTHCCHDTNMLNGNFNIFTSDTQDFFDYMKRFYEDYSKKTLPACKTCSIGGSENSHTSSMKKVLGIMRAFNVNCDDFLKNNLKGKRNDL